MKCCICGCQIQGYGNNPDGAVWKTEDGSIHLAEFKENQRCCDICDSVYVIPGRIYRWQLMNQKQKEGCK